MFTILIRTIIIYFLLILTMRIMGKRQLGELDVGELVITILLSEIATTPITNPDRPFIEALVPIATLVFLEVITSVLILRSPKFKKIFSSSPSVLIAKGVIDYKKLKKSRVSLEELISQIRQNGVYDICEVDYAILEENGRMSVIPKNANRQPDKCDMGIKCEDNGVMHIVISDGQISAHGLKIINKDKKWLEKQVARHKLSIKDVFCMTVDDSGKIFIQLHSGKQITKE